jgi:RHS repeat-associated protein
VASKPVYTWDIRAQRAAHDYDELQRLTHTRLRVGTTESVVARSVYGEALDSGTQNLDPNAPSAAQTLNLRGQGYLLFDSAGLALSDHYDFKGNLLSTTRHIATTYQSTPDWSSVAETLNFATFEADLVTANLLEATNPAQPMRFTTTSAFDALNRVTSHTTPDGSVTTPTYNRANLLETVTVQQGTTTTHVITNIDYNEKGQRILCAHGEQTAGAANSPAYTINYAYDPKTFRLTQITTRRASDNAKLQDLNYTYDPVGNIVELDDNADWNPLFSNAPVTGNGLYEYDAIYRLTHAEGREHPGQQVTDVDSSILDIKLPNANDLGVVAGYREDYVYDEVGNIKSVSHALKVPDTRFPAWTRNYAYATDNNRLLRTSLPGDDPSQPNLYSAPYSYDDTTTNTGGRHGSMMSMPHLPAMEWDFADRLQHVNKGGGGDVYFTYDGSGQRVRKVYVHSGLREERTYLGGYEIYRKRVDAPGSAIDLERQTLHVMDDQRRVAMVETKTVDTTPSATVPTKRWRFQLDNHLGSAMLEVDAQGNIVGYEEYHPYGTSALRLSNGDSEVSAKRYRYTGKERDEETSLYYHGARYYAPWLGRWTAADPAGTVDGTNLFLYARDNPIFLSDPTGHESKAHYVRVGVPVHTTGEESVKRLHEIAAAVRTEALPYGFTFKGKPKALPGGRWDVGEIIPLGPHGQSHQDGTHGPSHHAGGTGTGHHGTSKGSHGTGPDEGTGGDKAPPKETALDELTKAAGVVNSPGSEGKPEGVSGGIPGGHGPTANASRAAQLLYIGLAVYSVVQLAKLAFAIAKAAVRAIGGAIGAIIKSATRKAAASAAANRAEFELSGPSASAWRARNETAEQHYVLSR